MASRLSQSRHIAQRQISKCRWLPAPREQFYSTCSNFNSDATIQVQSLQMPSNGVYRTGSRRSIHKLLGVSTRDMADLEDQVWSAVGARVKDPEVNVDLKSLGWLSRKLAISEDQTVQVLLKLPTLLHPSLEDLKNLVKVEAEGAIKRWASEKGINTKAKVNVEAIASQPKPWMTKDSDDLKEIEATLGPGLSHVAHCIAVYSCKGGVGKSTIAVNLAYELARMGGRVGILDLDVYGPSLPVLVRPDDPAVRQSPLGSGMVYPIEHKGVKMLSLGFVSSKSGVPGSGQGAGAAVLRGPMAGKVVTQLLKGTDWGDLDVLVLDMPPGTGDVQLTICQELDLSGAVGVTTPSKLAIADARKGIEMFSSIGIPTLALVENMAYFECESGGRHYPFGKGFSDFLKEEDALKGLSADDVCQLPISPLANDANDSGVPLSLSRPKAAESELSALRRLARVVSKELFLLPYHFADAQDYVTFEGNTEKFDISTIQLSEDNGSLLVRAFSDNGALQKRIAPEELKNRNPQTGQALEPLHEKESLRGEDGMVTLHRSGSCSHSTTLIEGVTKKAKVGYEVTWSDGKKFIYSRRAVAVAAGGMVVK